MFLEYYRLREQPFGVTPDPRYLYFSPGHREALASLYCGIETGRGFLALIAEPGMGKTTLLFQLLERLKDTVRSVFLFQTQCDSRELLRYLLDGLGIDSAGGDPVHMHARLNEFLLREAAAGRRVVVFIDEAQNLSDSVLETVRLLSDFESPDRKLLQIVLAGQPELAHKLVRPHLSQLRQRIAVLTHLHPMPAKETVRYIQHRLQLAGYQGPELFTPGALALIAERSAGVPRNINNLCYSAMSLGCATASAKIGQQVVQEAAGDLSLDSYVRPAAPAPQPLPALQSLSRAASLPMSFEGFQAWMLRSLVAAAVLVGLLFYFGQRATGEQAQPPARQSAVVNAPVQKEASSAAPPPVSAIPASLPDTAPAETNTNAEPASFTYVVRQRDTLSRLSLRLLGRYDAALLAEIRELNPDLYDVDSLDVGQVLRLPRHPSGAESAAPVARADDPQYSKRQP